MAFGRRQLVVVLLLFLVVSSTAVPVSSKAFQGSLKTISNFHSQDVEERESYDGVLERRMGIELTDYPGTGANHNHDPRPPGNS